MGLRICILKFPETSCATLHKTILCVADICTTSAVQKVLTALCVGGIHGSI